MTQQENARRTRQWLLDYMAQTGKQPTVMDYARWTMINKTTAQRHLAILTDSGALEVYTTRLKHTTCRVWMLPGSTPDRPVVEVI